MQNPNLPKFFLVFDVESIGLHGEGFAVGYVVKSAGGEHMADGMFSCGPLAASGTEENLEWVMQNVPKLECNCISPSEVRERFWAVWLEWKARGAVLAADCCWPVEARFLAACVDDDPAARQWEGPYPLHDLASVMLAAGRNPLATNERLSSELPTHDPLNDAMQSARLLLEALSQQETPA